jgi:hypothetical protein
MQGCDPSAEPRAGVDAGLSASGRLRTTQPESPTTSNGEEAILQGLEEMTVQVGLSSILQRAENGYFIAGQ